MSEHRPVELSLSHWRIWPQGGFFSGARHSFTFVSVRSLQQWTTFSLLMRIKLIFWNVSMILSDNKNLPRSKWIFCENQREQVVHFFLQYRKDIQNKWSNMVHIDQSFTPIWKICLVMKSNWAINLMFSNPFKLLMNNFNSATVSQVSLN